jgi:glycosyltransferase involved in cell wall biosynthesis
MVSLRSPTLDELPAPPPGRRGWPWTAEASLDRSPTAVDAMWPVVTVVTPSLDQAGYIEETIRSVLLQGYPSVEYVVMDGGSTDGTVEIIERYAPWLSGWVSRPDGGQTAAINAAWSNASGDILAYINADDCYRPGALWTAAKALVAAPGAGMAYGSADVVDETGREVRRWQARPFSLTAMLAAGNVVPQPSAFYRRAAVDEVGLLDEAWDMIMDYEFAIRIGLRRPSVCIPVVLSSFRDHPKSKSRSRQVDLTRELIRFVSGFDAGEVPESELRALRRRALARIRYERALAIVAAGGDARTALASLGRSLHLDPALAYSRPRQTTYLAKELLRAGLTRRPGRAADDVHPG